MNEGHYTRCTRCDKLVIAEETTRFVPDNAEGDLEKRLHSYRICPPCVGVMIMEYREQNCRRCNFTATNLERTFKALDTYRRTGRPQALRVEAKGYIHREGCKFG